MRTWQCGALWIAIAVIAACDSNGEVTKGEAAPAPETAKAAAPPELPTCPDGGEEKQLSIPSVATEMRWCEKEVGGRGVRHGPWRKSRDGRLLESGSYRDGVKEGPWKISAGAGLTQEGDYASDERTGVWILRDASGKELRKVEYGNAPARPPEAAAAPEPSPTLTLRIDNTRETDLELILEPSGETLDLPAGAGIELRSPVEGGGDLEIEAGEDAIVLRSRGGADLRSAPGQDR